LGGLQIYAFISFVKNTSRDINVV